MIKVIGWSLLILALITSIHMVVYFAINSKVMIPELIISVFCTVFGNIVLDLGEE